jgi:RNA polymerase sigma-70 factor (ECF subfamily)
MAGTAAHLAEQELVVVVRGGDVEAFACLVDRHHGPLLRHLAWRTGDRELPADLAQEAFLDAFRHLDRLPADRSFAAWLYRIAQNHARMAERRKRLRRFVSLDWFADPAAAVPAFQRPDGSESLHERDLLAQALASLSPSLREPLLLHSLDGFTAPEVAGILGISLAAAERRISRAKEQFRQRYRALGEEGPR